MRTAFGIASIIPLGITLGVLLGGATVQATTAGDGRGHSPMRALLGSGHRAKTGDGSSLRERLHLSDDQRAAIREVLGAHRQEIAAAVKPVVEARRALRAAIIADTVDTAAIVKASGALGEAIGKAAVLMASVKHEIADKAKLTDEQRNVLHEAKGRLEEAVDSLLDGAGATTR